MSEINQGKESSANQEPGTKRIFLDQALLDAGAEKSFGNKGTEIALTTPRDIRKQYKLVISGCLAAFLWVTLTGVIIWHLCLIGSLCNSFLKIDSSGSTSSSQNSANTSSDGALERRFDKSTAQVNDTAKTIYTFLVPLLVAATTYYFKEANQDDNDD
jgi:hypothetical protein